MFAERLAQIQMGVDFDESQHCPRYDVTCVPDELASDIDDQPIGIRTHFEYALPKLRALASELADTCPISLDHPDLNPSNGILSESGEVVIIDWEESAFGCALFSLDRLLDIDLLKSQKERNLVCDAYLGQLGLGRTTEVRRKWNISQCLVPLRRASEARYFARAMNRSNPHTRITGHLISKCLSRMEVAEL
jgi:aminoglycoside phosphotransferase (APT) family kinase protein